jgi:hypothetical protein
MLSLLWIHLSVFLGQGKILLDCAIDGIPFGLSKRDPNGEARERIMEGFCGEIVIYLMNFNYYFPFSPVSRAMISILSI